MRKSRDNIAGVSPRSLPHKIYVFPGQVWQWFRYMGADGKYADVQSQTRTSRSPLMTYVVATCFWFTLVVVALLVWADKSGYFDALPYS